jgi:hypothetical protein
MTIVCSRRMCTLCLPECPSTREGTTLFNHSVLFTFKVTFLGCSVLSGNRLSPPLKLMPFVLDNTLFLGRSSPPSFILRRCSTSRKGLSPCGTQHTSLQSTLSRRLEQWNSTHSEHNARVEMRAPSADKAVRTLGWPTATRTSGARDHHAVQLPTAYNNLRFAASGKKDIPFLPPTELRPQLQLSCTTGKQRCGGLAFMPRNHPPRVARCVVPRR